MLDYTTKPFQFDDNIKLFFELSFIFSILPIRPPVAAKSKTKTDRRLPPLFTTCPVRCRFDYLIGVHYSLFTVFHSIRHFKQSYPCKSVLMLLCVVRYEARVRV